MLHIPIKAHDTVNKPLNVRCILLCLHKLGIQASIPVPNWIYKHLQLFWKSHSDAFRDSDQRSQKLLQLHYGTGNMADFDSATNKKLAKKRSRHPSDSHFKTLQPSPAPSCTSTSYLLPVEHTHNRPFCSILTCAVGLVLNRVLCAQRTTIPTTALTNAILTVQHTPKGVVVCSCNILPCFHAFSRIIFYNYV